MQVHLSLTNQKANNDVITSNSVYHVLFKRFIKHLTAHCFINKQIVCPFAQQIPIINKVC